MEKYKLFVELKNNESKVFETVVEHEYHKDFISINLVTHWIEIPLVNVIYVYPMYIQALTEETKEG